MNARKTRKRNKISARKKLIYNKRSGTDTAIRRAVRHNFTTSTQSFGLGGKTLNLTYTNKVTVTQGSQYYVRISNFLELDEFLESIENYQYYKILGLGVTIYPNDTMNNNPCYINVNWVEEEALTNQQIMDSDQTKIVFNDQKNIKTYIFKPPKSQIQLGSAWVNLSQFITYNRTGTNLIPGRVTIYQEYINNETADNTINFRIDLRMKLRTNYVKNNSNKNKMIIHELKQIDETEDSGDENFLVEEDKKKEQ